MIRRLLLSLALLCGLAACRVDVGVDLMIGVDGSGALTVTATADADVVQQAPGLADDLRFDDAIAAGWAVDGPTATADGGLAVRLSHPVTSAEDATSLLASLGPPFADMRLERTASPDNEETTFALTGQLTLPAGFDSFADSDLLAAVGGTPFADELAAAGATPADSMAIVLRAELPGDVEETTGRDTDGVLDWDAPMDGTASAVTARTIHRPPGGGGWAGPLAAIALVLFVLWVVVAAAFIVSVGRARSRRARSRAKALRRLDR